MLSNCRSCSHQVSIEAYDCPKCREVYPTLSETEVEIFHANCISYDILFSNKYH